MFGVNVYFYVALNNINELDINMNFLLISKGAGKTSNIVICSNLIMWLHRIINNEWASLVLDHGLLKFEIQMFGFSSAIEFKVTVFFVV